MTLADYCETSLFALRYVSLLPGLRTAKAGHGREKPGNLEASGITKSQLSVCLFSVLGLLLRRLIRAEILEYKELTKAA